MCSNLLVSHIHVLPLTIRAPDQITNIALHSRTHDISLYHPSRFSYLLLMFARPKRRDLSSCVPDSGLNKYPPADLW